MKLLLTGVTGAAGIQIFRTALLDPAISSITVLSRRPLPAWMDLPPNASTKAKTIVLSSDDFLHYPASLVPTLADHDACIWALGTSSGGMTEEDYTRITYNYTMAAVDALAQAGVGKGEMQPFRFIFISGEGADQTEKSWMLFGRIKGRTEKALLNIPSSLTSSIKSTIIRPAYFFPSPDHPSDRDNIRPASGRIMDNILTPLMRTVFPGQYTPIEGLGKFAVEAAKGRWDSENVVSNKRMKELLKTL